MSSSCVAKHRFASVYNNNNNNNIIIIIMDLQMVEDDYIYNTIQLTLQKKTFRPINQSEEIAPKHKIAKKAAYVIVLSTILKFSAAIYPLNSFLVHSLSLNLRRESCSS